MAALSTLWVELRASTAQFAADMSQAQKEIRAFDKDVKPITDRLKEFGNAATTAGKALTVAVTAPIAAIAGVGIAFNAMQEQAQIAFTTMLGSGSKAKTFLEDLKNFAAKTPFEFPDLVRATQRLIAMGFSADQVKPTMIAVGNAVAGLGGGAAEINRVTLALGQMQGRGKVATQEMNQLTEVGIPAWAILANAFGVSEMKLRDMVEKGVVPANKAVTALVEGMNERFPNMMDLQSRTFTGLMSTIKDEIRFLAGDLTSGLFNALKGPAEGAAATLHMLREAMAEWSDQTKAAIVISGAFAAALGPMLLVVGQLALGFNQFIILGGHAGILLAKIGLESSLTAIALTAATAGVVAVGAAVGIAIGLFTNWILKITGLSAAFDNWLRSIVNMIPGIGKVITGQKAMDDAAAGATFAQQKLIAEFSKHGVAVDAARLSDAQYVAGLANMAKQWAHNDEEAAKWFSNFSGKPGTVKSAYADMFPGLGGGTGVSEYSKNVEALEKSLRKTTVEQNALAQAVAYAQEKHISANVILDAFGGKLKEIAADHRENGIAINANLLPLIKMMEAHEAMKRVLDAQDQEINKEVDSLRDQQIAWQGVLNAERDWSLQAESDSATMRRFRTEIDAINDSADRANRTMRENLARNRPPILPGGALEMPPLAPPVLGTGTPRTTGQWLEEWDRQAKAAAEETRKLNEATKEVERSAGKVFDALFLGKGGHPLNFQTVLDAVGGLGISLGRSLFQSIAGQLFGPLKAGFDEFFKGLIDSIGLKGFLTDIGKKLGDVFKDKAVDKAVDTATGAATDTAISAAGGAAQTAAGVGSSIASAASGLVGTINMVSGIASAVGSIVGAIGTMRLEGTMNAVEYNTRAAMIHSQVMIDSFFAPWTSIFEWSLNWAHESAMILDAIYNLMLAGGGVGAGATAGVGGVTNNITFNITSPAAAKEAVDYLDEVITTGRWGYREKWTMIFNQNAGVVSTVPAG